MLNSSLSTQVGALMINIQVIVQVIKGLYREETMYVNLSCYIEQSIISYIEVVVVYPTTLLTIFGCASLTRRCHAMPLLIALCFGKKIN